MSIAIIVHGGAGIITPERAEITQAGCKEAAALGWQVLQNNGTALAAVEAAVRALEDNPHYNAGTGSMLTADGRIEMDAGIMEGHTLNVGAVASVELIKNPILLARKVLESPYVLLVGQGAQQFALEQGMAFRCGFFHRHLVNWLLLSQEVALLCAKACLQWPLPNSTDMHDRLSNATSLGEGLVYKSITLTMIELQTRPRSLPGLVVGRC
jgi:isoaspartyl peptidase/L-asparaginase-like protein (Ntn-hydrolase superfamily)